MPAMRPLPLILSAAILLAGAEARGEEAAAEAAPAGEGAAEAAGPAASTVQGLAEELVGQVGRLVEGLPRERLDMAVAIVVDLPGDGPGPARLGALVRQLVAGALSRSHGLRSVRAMEATAEGPWGEEGRARAEAATEGYELLLLATLDVEANYLVASGTVYQTEQHLWRDLVEPERALLGEVFVRRRVDAEVRHHLGPIGPPRPLTTRSLQLGRPGYLALAVADLDGDDRAEIVLLRRRELEVRRLEGETLVAVAGLGLADIRLAATPARDPVGTIAIGPRRPDGTRPIAFRTSDHGQGGIARFDGETLAMEGDVGEDYPIRYDEDGALECASVRAGRSAFETEPAPCGALEAGRAVSPYYGVDEAVIARPVGPPGRAAAMVTADGRALLRWEGRAAGALRSFGTAVAVTDVDDDGVAEVLLSSDREAGRGDELTVVRIEPGGGDPGREVLPELAGSVWAAAAGDADDDGLRELLAISESGTGSRLLVIE